MHSGCRVGFVDMSKFIPPLPYSAIWLSKIFHFYFTLISWLKRKMTNLYLFDFLND